MVVFAAPFSQVSGAPVAISGRRSQSATGGSGLYYSGSETGWEIAAKSVAEAYRATNRDLSNFDNDFAPHAKRLGTLTAELHIALADALDTITADQADPAELYERMRAHLYEVVNEVPQLGQHAADINELFAAVETAATHHRLQRIHGDYHLDQVLHIGSDQWIVIDFEGEPVRNLDERRHLFTPLRDVAGMLRSFDYAAYYPLLQRPNQAARRKARAVEWSTRNRAAFLDGYVDRAILSGLLPEQYQLLLFAFEMDKAVYEVRYEARHRPEWLPIPLQGIRRLLASFHDFRHHN